MGKFAKYLDDMTGTDVATETAPVSAPPPTPVVPPVDIRPASAPAPRKDVLPLSVSPQFAPAAREGYGVSTATTPQQTLPPPMAAKEELQAGLTADDRSSLMRTLGYKGLRGLTLGASDRLVGLGNAIGERAAAATNATAPANPNTYQQSRAEYLRAEDEAAKGHKVAGLAAEVAGSIPGTIALGPLAPAVRFGRFVPPAVQGGVQGGFNTRSDEPADIAKGVGAGAGIGLAGEATLGTLFGKAIGGAPKRKEDYVIRDVMESEAGRANLRTAGFQIARDIDDVRSVLKEYPEVAKAARLPATEALPVVRKRVAEVYKGQDARYAEVDKALAEKGQEMTAFRLLQKLVDAERGLPTKDRFAVQAILKDMRDELRQSHFPEWIGEPTYSGQSLTIPTATLREWVTAAQDSAARTMGKINGTATYKVPEAAARIANDILEEQLDKAAARGLGPTVAQIRDVDRKTSALLGISAAIKDRGQKEALQAVGLSGRLGAEHRKQELAAAAGLAATGHLAPAAALMVANPSLRALSSASREVNDRLLAPLEEAAAVGGLKAQLAKQAIVQGMPRGGGAAALNLVRGQGPYAPAFEPEQPPVAKPGTPTVDWRASTAVR